MALRTEAQRRRREAARALRERAAASRAVPQEEPVQAAGTSTVWRSSELPTPQTAQAGVPLSEGITSVFLGAVLYIPVALVTGYASWNYLVALVLVVALSYALCSLRVVAGPGFVAVRKFGPYRVAQADAVRSGAIKQTQRGGVLTVRTGDGRTMRLRRVEHSSGRGPCGPSCRKCRRHGPCPRASTASREIFSPGTVFDPASVQITWKATG